ncbi:MAG: hypothetical protein ACXVEF_18665 [Polyangiales bacterium]
MSAKGKFVVVGIAGLLGLATIKLACTSAKTAAEDPSLIDGKFWVAARTEKLTDKVHAAIFLSSWNLGLFDESSYYAGRHEFFEFTRKGAEVKGYFGQTDKSWTITYEVNKCDELPPFDLCLKLSANPWGGPKKYYGFSDPEEESKQLGKRAKAARAQLAANH